MKIIGISGGSGAGKSTVSKKLAQMLPNSLLIDGDIFMYEESEKFENDIFKEIGIKKDKNVYSYNYYFESLENMKIWVKYIQDGVISKIKKKIEVDGAEKDYVIIDWVFLPMCNYFKNCDYTLCVKTDYDKTLGRLVKRLDDKEAYNQGDKPLWEYKTDIIKNRVMYTVLDNLGFEPKYKIKNDEDIDELYKNVKKFAEFII